MRELSMYELCLCRMQGDLFRLAWQKGYAMEEFVTSFMNSQVAADLDSSYHRLQWSGEEYVLNTLVRACQLYPECRPETLNDEALYWAGYVYRQWHFETAESSREIYKKVGYHDMMGAYAGYHTLSCEQAIRRLQEESKEVSAA